MWDKLIKIFKIKKSICSNCKNYLGHDCCSRHDGIYGKYLGCHDFRKKEVMK